MNKNFARCGSCARSCLARRAEAVRLRDASLASRVRVVRSRCGFFASACDRFSPYASRVRERDAPHSYPARPTRRPSLPTKLVSSRGQAAALSAPRHLRAALRLLAACAPTADGDCPHAARAQPVEVAPPRRSTSTTSDEMVPHKDGYSDQAAITSLGSDAVLDFWHAPMDTAVAREMSQHSGTAVPDCRERPRSVLDRAVCSCEGAALSDFVHGLASRAEDRFDGETIARRSCRSRRCARGSQPPPRRTARSSRMRPPRASRQRE